MLTIQCANISGFFSYAMHETIPLDNQGVVLLTGVNTDRLTTTANAAGKSSLLNAITHILYGQNPTEKGEDKIVNEVWGHGCWGMVKFTNNGKQYRIILTRGWKGPYPDVAVENEPCQIHVEGQRYAGTGLYYDIFENGRWKDLHKTRVAETRAIIISNLGISYDRFLATSYLAQQKGLAFINGRNKDRMELITELTDMRIWDECVAQAKRRLKMAEISVEKFNVEIAKWNSKAVAYGISLLSDPEISRAEIRILNDANAVTQAELERQNLALSDTTSRRIDMRRRMAEAERTIEDINTEINELKRDIVNENISIARLTTQKAQSVKDPNIENGNSIKMHELMSHKWDLERRLTNMLPGAGKCDKCGSNVSDTTLMEEKATLLLGLSGVNSNISSLDLEMIGLVKETQFAHEAAIDTHIIAATHALDGLSEKLTAANAELIKARRTITDLTAEDMEISSINTKLQIEVIKLKLHIETNVQRIKTIETSLEKDAELRRLILEAKDEAGKAQYALNLVIESQRYHEAIVKGMGDKGVKAHKFGAMIQILNDLVADNIKVLTDGQVQVWFSPWREKANAKSDEDVVPEIQIFVKEGPKEQVELALYSGMERQQIVIAIIRAFNKLAMTQGAGTNLLFMDEMFGMFDEASAGTAIKLMNQLKCGEWGTIIIVTHNPDIKQVLDYDQLWTAVKSGHITTLKRETV
jgi:DNA repair exonuclease SbcCD ATPase subunit